MAKAKKKAAPKKAPAKKPAPGINRSLIQRRTETIDRLTDNLAAKIRQGERSLFNKLVAEVVENLETKGGRILISTYNKKIISSIETVYASWLRTSGASIVRHIIDGADELLALNAEYFRGFGEPGTLKELSAASRAAVYENLGITAEKKIIADGYLNTMMQNPTVKAKIKRQAHTAMITGKDIGDYKKNVQDFVTGTKKKPGALNEFYKDTAMDVIPQVDRVVGVTHANGLDLTCAIYEGSLILTSRPFCRKRAGKVYHISEIKKFNPPTAKPPNYNPLLDLGGYNCRHHLNWISNELAVRLRPTIARLLPNKKRPTSE